VLSMRLEAGNANAASKPVEAAPLEPTLPDACSLRPRVFYWSKSAISYIRADTCS
jgi:hypothetical protein